MPCTLTSLVTSLPPPVLPCRVANKHMAVHKWGIDARKAEADATKYKDHLLGLVRGAARYLGAWVRECLGVAVP